MKIHVSHKDFAAMVDIFLVDEPTDPLRQGDLVAFYHFRDDGMAIRHGVPYSDLMGQKCNEKPSMSLPRDVWEAMVMAFQEYAKKEHFPQPTESYLKGQLEATVQHLSDMRKLVFKEPHEPKRG